MGVASATAIGTYDSCCFRGMQAITADPVIAYVTHDDRQAATDRKFEYSLQPFQKYESRHKMQNGVNLGRLSARKVAIRYRISADDFPFTFHRKHGLFSRYSARNLSRVARFPTSRVFGTSLGGSRLTLCGRYFKIWPTTTTYHLQLTFRRAAKIFKDTFSFFASNVVVQTANEHSSSTNWTVEPLR